MTNVHLTFLVGPVPGEQCFVSIDGGPFCLAATTSGQITFQCSTNYSLQVTDSRPATNGPWTYGVGAGGAGYTDCVTTVAGESEPPFPVGHSEWSAIQLGMSHATLLWFICVCLYFLKFFGRRVANPYTNFSHD